MHWRTEASGPGHPHPPAARGTLQPAAAAICYRHGLRVKCFTRADLECCLRSHRAIRNGPGTNNQKESNRSAPEQTTKTATTADKPPVTVVKPCTHRLPQDVRKAFEQTAHCRG